jgi:hypothetical protein
MPLPAICKNNVILRTLPPKRPHQLGIDGPFDHFPFQHFLYGGLQSIVLGTAAIFPI